jgi:hypothetical protein
MLRPLSQHSTRARGVQLTSKFPSFTQNALFSDLCPGLGRGSMNQVTLGGKSIPLSKEMNIDPESKVTINAINAVNAQPGQFDDAIEGKRMFQSLAEPIKDPLKQLYEERQLSSPSLRSKRNSNKQKISDQLSLGAYKREKEYKREHGSYIYQVKQPARKKNKNDLNKNLRQTDFVAQDINWSDFINSNTNELNHIIFENKEQEALQLELEGGDYNRYLSFPKSIQEKFNLNNDIANSIQKTIGQNPSYKLPEKKLIYETLFQNLNKSAQQNNKK